MEALLNDIEAKASYFVVFVSYSEFSGKSEQ
jgi:hypothetical protein